MSLRSSSHRNQRGSALLIVFVFAAILAITLFTEMPVIIFEAQRNREQLLMDRGNEYSQAVKLYLRKTGQYPPTIDALENTNRIRFLRKRFKDPFTDKTDWRLLHAGPNGMLLDSKIKLAKNVQGAGNSPLGTFNNNGANQNGTNQSSPFGATSPGNSGFSGGGFNSGSGAGGSSNGFGAANPSNNGFGGNQPPRNANTSNGANNPAFPGGIASNGDGIDPNVVPAQRSSAMPGPVNGNLAPGQLPNPDGTNPNVAAAQRGAFPPGTNGSAVGAIDPSQSSVTQVGGAQGFGGFASSTGPSTGTQQPSGNPNNPNAAVNGLFSNPNPSAPQTNGFNSSNGPSSSFAANSFGSSSNTPGNSNATSGFGSSTFGAAQGGSLAGVASKAERHSIKVFNEQQDYSLWEFYYDPSKDPARNPAGALSQTGGGAINQPGNSTGQQLPGNSQSNPFGNQTGSSAAGSGFGNFGGGLSGMGNSQNQSGQGQSFRGQNSQGTGFGSTQSAPPQQSTFPQQPPPQ